MKCPKCDFDNPADSRFCSKCRAKLDLSRPFRGTIPTSSEKRSDPPEEISVSKTKTLQISIKEMTAGTIFAGKYKIIEELGKGGMGIVYKAEDTKLKRTVALKFLSPALTLDIEARERFVHEAQAASGLDHPNICTIHEIDDTEDGQIYIAMAYYRGESLKEKIKRGPLELEETLDVATQMAQGLDKAHERGIIHRDIKPANIMLTDEGLLKIVDFGLAKLAGMTRITKIGTTMGTVAYMSPEQARGEEVDQRTDVWSLGVILYEMVTGQLPFKGENEQAVVYSILNEEPSQVKDLPAGVPLELEQIIGRALAKDPEKRFLSSRHLAQALEELKSKLISEAYPVTRRFLFRKPLRRTLIGATAGILVLATILIIWMLTRPGLAFESRDKLMVADVDNQTGDSVFNLALRTAIEADLQQSPYAVIFDRNQVADTLRLMRKDSSTHVNEEIGTDICRFSGVRALILPRILSAGEAYELQAIVIDPVRKRHVDRIRVTALGREEVLLHAIDKLAHQVRSRLGESIDSIEEADDPVVKVTTSSWEALNQLSMGMTKWQEGKFKEAAALFELALESDPHFVSAKGSLGLVLIQFLGQKEKGQEMLRQALIDAEEQNIPQREYLKLKAVNREFVDGDLEGALNEYRIIRELYPDLWSAYNNPGVILRTLGRYDDAVLMFEKAAERAPRNSIPLTNLWFTHINYRKDPYSTEEIGRRLTDLSPKIANYQHALAWSLVAQARFEEALEVLRKTVALEPHHPYGFPNLAHILLVTDAAAEAVPIYRELRELIRQGLMHGSYVKESFDLALALAEAGEFEEAKKVAEEGKQELLKKLEGASPNAQNLLLLGQLEAVSGRLDEAKKYLNKALKEGVKDPYTTMNLAELYALLGEDELAIETIKQALESGYWDFFFPLVLPAFQSIRDDPRFRALFKFNSE